MAIIFEDLFNNGLTNWNSSGNSPTIENINGNNVFSVELDRYSDSTPYRTEGTLTNLSTEDWDYGMFARYGDVWWYGVKVFIPNNFVIDSFSGEKIMQWHGVPDIALGENYRNPMISLGVYGTQYRIIVCGDAGQITPLTDPRYDRSASHYFGSVAADIGKWTSWAWRIKWGYDSSGECTLYRDGVQVYADTGANCFNDVRGPYFKMGCYKWDWKDGRPETGTDYRLYYYDEFRIGDENAILADIMGEDVPAGDQSITISTVTETDTAHELTLVRAIVTDVNTNEVVSDNETNVTYTVDNFDSTITTVALVSGTASTSATGVTASDFDLPDVSSYSSTTAGSPFTTASHTVVARLSDGIETAELTVSYEPQDGWAVVEVSNASTQEGSVFEDFVGTVDDGCQIYYSTADNTNITSSGVLTTDSAASMDCQFYDVSDSSWKQFTIILLPLVGLVTETGTAVEITPSLSLTINTVGAATETDAAQTLAPRFAIAETLEQVTETDTAQTIQPYTLAGYGRLVYRRI